MKYFFLLLSLLFVVLGGYAQQSRIVYTINENWFFAKGNQPEATSLFFDDQKWSTVHIPHTWNAVDAVDDISGYYRGEGWYRKKISIPVQMKGKQVYVYFEGANQETEVFVNGNFIGRHIGGYTRFNFDITDYVNYGEENQFTVKVNNRKNNDIPPLAADFTFWGGIYRDVYLIFTNKIHFATTHFASSGVYVNTDVSEKKANINIRNLLTNDNDVSETINIETTIVDPLGKVVTKKMSTHKIEAKATITSITSSIVINDPLLWNTQTPNLYTIYSRIYNEKGGVIDDVKTNIGLRWYEFLPDSGFYLNGKPQKLIGTNRHQDYKEKGNALRDEMHVRDIQLLKEMGGNFLRISHYPQDPVVMEMCDKLGILTSVEIPIISTISESEAFYNNSLQMAKEMVFQDYNRPSVIVWAYMNEVLLHPLYKDDKEKQQHYFKAVYKLAQGIENFIRQEDKNRYTMMACHGGFEIHHETGLLKIPMILGWNLYQGWYGGEFTDFDKFLEKVHKVYPDKSLFVTEYGADVDTRLHSFTPSRFDFTVEYGNLFHEYYLKSIIQKPFVAGAMIWNLNDFYSEARKDAVPHVNNKGITELNREPKDTYFLYQAALKQTPVLKIGSKTWKTRGGIENSFTNTCIQPISIYTNLSQIEVFLNGKSLGITSTIDYVVKKDIPFQQGLNVIEVVGVNNGTPIRDILEVNFKMIPSDLTYFTEMNILFGSHRYFEDKDASMIWVPEKEYTMGSWGYIGGQTYIRQTTRGVLRNSDKNIFDTEQDPIFQTQRIGIESFKADVPDGVYSLYFYWATLDLNNEEVIIYNLGNDAIGTNVGESIFDISVNNSTILYEFNPAKESKGKYGIIKKININVSDGKGITINFNTRKGRSILNALRIYKNY